MEYQAAELHEDGTIKTPDRFICPQNKRDPISIQDSIHEFYHIFHRKSEISGQVNGLKLYRRKPLIAEALLEYRPNHSGRLPTDHADLKLSPSVNKGQTATSVVNCQRWIMHTPLKAETRAKAEEKEENQKLNRRKWGDSPSTN